MDTNFSTQTGLARTPELPSTFSERQVAPWADPNQRLRPATRDEFRTELTACIALCMPAGFDGDARREWLRAAWGTLDGIPADLLKTGCADARKTADHPSKVVPAIMRSIGALWEARKAAAAREREGIPLPPGRSNEDYVSPEQAAAILQEFDLAADRPAKTRIPPRMPTPDEQAAMAKRFREKYAAIDAERAAEAAAVEIQQRWAERQVTEDEMAEMEADLDAEEERYRRNVAAGFGINDDRDVEA